MKKAMMAAWLAVLPLSQAALAASVTGVVRTLHINLETGVAHVQLVGSPVLSSEPAGPNCPRPSPATC
jgi:hypothetical protein